MKPDADILWAVVANVRARASYGQRRAALWALVHGATALGSTAAAELCRRFGFEPDSTSAATDNRTA